MNGVSRDFMHSNIVQLRILYLRPTMLQTSNQIPTGPYSRIEIVDDELEQEGVEPEWCRCWNLRIFGDERMFDVVSHGIWSIKTK